MDYAFEFLATDIIIIDTETTGLNFDLDEVLQLSIINFNGDVLFDEYIKPGFVLRWDGAERVNNISPQMVADKPYMDYYLPKIKRIFESAKMVIGYNVHFDLRMLRKYGVYPADEAVVYDVMSAFSVVYGEWSDYYGNYKWQKLSTCADYYNYKFNAHNSLEDAKATLYCYKCMNNIDV